MNARARRRQQEMRGEYEANAAVGESRSLFEFVCDELRETGIGPRCKTCEYLSWFRCSQKLVGRWTLKP